MIVFCEGFKCRRKFLLEYFGEHYEKENCGYCDRCVRPQNEFDGTSIGRVVLECVQLTGERFGTQYIVDVLRGSRNARILGFKHDQLGPYGQGRAFSVAQLKEIIGLLIEKKFLVKATGEYPVIGLTSEGKSFLKGRESLMLRPTRVDGMRSPQLPAPEKDKPRKYSSSRDHNANYDQDLFEELRKLRKQLADSRGVPSFVIFADTALRQMAHDFPRDRGSFLNITGVGHQKLEQFGPIFIKNITDYCRVHGL
jgi:ATP-dependent DNA helicase RecQ